MLQMTIGVSHQINICGLEDILKSGIFDDWTKQHPNEKLRMIFIVHPSVYKEFTKQTYTYNYVAEEGNSKDDSEKGLRNTEKRKEERKAAIESKVTQYVMAVDLEKRLKVLLQPGVKRLRQEEDTGEREKKRQKKKCQKKEDIGETKKKRQKKRMR